MLGAVIPISLGMVASFALCEWLIASLLSSFARPTHVQNCDQIERSHFWHGMARHASGFTIGTGAAMLLGCAAARSPVAWGANLIFLANFVWWVVVLGTMVTSRMRGAGRKVLAIFVILASALLSLIAFWIVLGVSIGVVSSLAI